jgi:hypothetical protein
LSVYLLQHAGALMTTDLRSQIGSPTNEHPRPADDTTPPAIRLNDLWARVVGIPFFGLVIPHATGLFASLALDDARYWLGAGWFILVSAVVWQGNRAILMRQRRQKGWFDDPVRKVVRQVGANLLYTVPVTFAMVAGWQRLAGVAPIDWAAVRLTTFVVAVSVLFVSHVYESVLLVHQRESDQLRAAELRRARAEAEIGALKSQVDPHFLFNALNALIVLIDRDPGQARAFTEGLADVYRYVVEVRDRDLVGLDEELEVAQAYAAVLQLRFNQPIAIEVIEDVPASTVLIVPISLQVLVENAVKHTRMPDGVELHIRMRVTDDAIEVDNAKRGKRQQWRSTHAGLPNLDERCRRVVGRGITITADERQFSVRVPVIERTLRTGGPAGR